MMGLFMMQTETRQNKQSCQSANQDAGKENFIFSLSWSLDLQFKKLGRAQTLRHLLEDAVEGLERSKIKKVSAASLHKSPKCKVSSDYTVLMILSGSSMKTLSMFINADQTPDWMWEEIHIYCKKASSSPFNPINCWVTDCAAWLTAASAPSSFHSTIL